MKAQNDKHEDKRMSSLLSAVDHGTNEPDRQFLEKLKERSTAEFLAFSTDGNKQSEKTIPISIWRIIMNSRITKLAAAAVIVIAVVLSVAVLDTPAYALEQTIKAYEGLRYVHMKQFAEGTSEPLEFWVELDEQEQVKRFRASIPAWAEPKGPMVAVWKNGKIQMLDRRGNILPTEEDRDSLGLEILNLVKGCDPRSIAKELYHLEAEGKVEITISEPPSKSEPIVLTAKNRSRGNGEPEQVTLFVDQNTKLVTRTIINKPEDGHQYSWEFSDYNVVLDERVFLVEPTPDMTEEFMKNINAKLASLDINTSSADDVIAVLGEPWAYRLRGEGLREDNLPEAYSMSYPGGFVVSIHLNQVTQWGLQQIPGDETPGYVFSDSIQIGTTLEDVFAKLGSPTKVVEGFGGQGNRPAMHEDNTGYADMNIDERKGFCFSRHDSNGKEIKQYFDDDVLYKDLGKIKGICLYGTVSKGRRIRFSFMDYKVVALYEYRTEPLPTIE